MYFFIEPTDTITLHVVYVTFTVGLGLTCGIQLGKGSTRVNKT